MQERTFIVRAVFTTWLLSTVFTWLLCQNIQPSREDCSICTSQSLAPGEPLEEEIDTHWTPNQNDCPPQTKGTSPTIASTPARRKNPSNVVCREFRKTSKIKESFGLETYSFGYTKCSSGKPLSALVTVLLPLLHPGNAGRLSASFMGLKVHLITNNTESGSAFSADDVFVERLPLDKTLGQAIADAVRTFKTPYTLLAMDTSSPKYNDDVELRRLISILDNYEVAAVGGSTRNPTDGTWRMQCMQNNMQRYTLQQDMGYKVSFEDCLVCDHIGGPFLMRTNDVEKYLDPSLDRDALDDMLLQAHYEFRLKNASANLVPLAICPDVMFNVYHSPYSSRVASTYIGLATKWGISRWRLPGKHELWFGCSHRDASWTLLGGPAASFNAKDRDVKKVPQNVMIEDLLNRGMALTPCAEQALGMYIYDVLDACQANGALCAAHSGIVLGALKMGGPLPWDNDGDVAYQEKKNANPGKMMEDLSAQNLHVIWKRGVPMRAFEGAGMIPKYGFTVDIHYPNKVELRRSWPRGVSQIRLQGRWINAARNPAKYYRDYYGGGIFKHKMLYAYTGKGHRHYASCSPPSPHLFHACIDQYTNDGNLQFEVINQWLS